MQAFCLIGTVLYVFWYPGTEYDLCFSLTHTIFSQLISTKLNDVVGLLYSEEKQLNMSPESAKYGRNICFLRLKLVIVVPRESKFFSLKVGIC